MSERGALRGDSRGRDPRRALTGSTVSVAYFLFITGRRGMVALSVREYRLGSRLRRSYSSSDENSESDVESDSDSIDSTSAYAPVTGPLARSIGMCRADMVRVTPGTAAGLTISKPGTDGLTWRAEYVP